MAVLIEVQTTVSAVTDAQRIADELLTRKLAACVQIHGPIVSRYHWQGVIQEDQEWVCIAKSSAALYDAIEAAILSIHPYQEPQIIALPVLHAASGYQQWVQDSVKS